MLPRPVLTAMVMISDPARKFGADRIGADSCFLVVHAEHPNTNLLHFAPIVNTPKHKNLGINQRITFIVKKRVMISCFLVQFRRESAQINHGDEPRVGQGRLGPGSNLSLGASYS